jgi:hypothetical protein
MDPFSKRRGANRMPTLLFSLLAVEIAISYAVKSIYGRDSGGMAFWFVA